MPTILEMKDTRNKLIAEAQKLLLNGNATTETRSQFDRMMSDVDTQDADIARHERIAKFEEEQRSASRPPRSQPGAEVRGSEQVEAEKRAFSQFIRFGQADAEHRSYLRSGSSETRDLLTTGAASSLIPQGFYPTLIEAQKVWGALPGAVRNIRTDTGSPYKVSFGNDTANQLTVVGEAAPVSEVDPTFIGVMSNTDKVTTGVVKVSFEQLQDSAFSLEDWLRDAFGKRYWRGVSNMITNGSSTGNVQGLVNNVPVVASLNHLTIGYQDLVNLYGAIDPAYAATATWVMNSSTRANMLGLTTGQGLPLYIPSPNSGLFDQLLGRPVILNQYQPSIGASTKPLLFGDLQQGYLLRSAADLSILRLNELFALTGEVGFVGYASIGGNVTDAGTHPITALQMAAS